MRRVTAAVFIVFVVSSLFATGQQASPSAVPRRVRISGAVTNADGTPRTGVVGVLFSVYPAQSGGTALWTEIQNVRPDANGQFSVVLGSEHPDGVPAELFSSGAALWLGIQSDGDPEQPRVELVSVPYALKAADADTLGGYSLQQILAGGVTLSPLTTVTGPIVRNAVTLAEPGRTTRTDSVASPIPGPRVLISLNNTPSGIVEAYNDATSVTLNLLLNPRGGNVGIGTLIPSQKLSVAGTIESTAGGFKFPDGTTLASAVIGTANIADKAVTQAKLADAAVGGGQIAAGAVTQAKIGTGAVGQAQIATGAVGSTQLGTGAVTQAKIADGAVGSAQLATGAVGSSQLANGAVGQQQVAGGYIDLSNSQTISGTKTFSDTIQGTASFAIGAGSFNGNLFGDVTGGQFNTIVVALQGTAVSSSFPSSGQFLTFDGAQWSPTTVNLPYLNRDAQDTSSASIATSGGSLYAFTQNNTTAATVDRSVLQLTDSTTSPSTHDYLLIGQSPTTFSVSTTGKVTATSFAGDGSLLTNVPSNTITGTLPIAHGGTGITTAPSAAGQYLRSTISGVWGVGSIAASDLPALAGDVTGTQSATVVGQIRGFQVSSAVPGAGQLFAYTGSQWAPTTIAGTALPYLNRNASDASSASVSSAGGNLFAFTQANTTAASADRAVLKLSDSTTSPGSHDYLLIGQNPSTFSVNTAGKVTAASFAGDGSALTNLPNPTILDNDTALSSPTIPAAGTFLYMAKTVAYTAGVNEVAIITVHASCTVPVGQGLGVRPGYNLNGGADTNLGSWHYATNTGTVAGNINNGQVQKLALTPDGVYIFSTALTNSDTATSYVAPQCFAHTFVQIF